jgi:hypothetical protein
MEILYGRLLFEVSQWQATKDPKASPGYALVPCRAFPCVLTMPKEAHKKSVPDFVQERIQFAFRKFF